MSEAEIIWAEFVSHCEAIEADAEGGLLRASDEKERQFCRGQAWAAKSIRRAVLHPKYRGRMGHARGSSCQEQDAKDEAALHDTRNPNELRRQRGW